MSRRATGGLEPLRCDCGAEMLLVCPKGCDGHELTKGRTFAAKPCRRCRREFTPTGPRSLDCPTCKGQST